MSIVSLKMPEELATQVLLVICYEDGLDVFRLAHGPPLWTKNTTQPR